MLWRAWGDRKADLLLQVPLNRGGWAGGAGYRCLKFFDINFHYHVMTHDWPLGCTIIYFRMSPRLVV